MEHLLPIAAKSFLVAGVVLLLLKLAKNRSASDRSCIAHLARAAALLLPVAAVALPALDVPAPSCLAGSGQPAVAAPAAAAPEAIAKYVTPASKITEAATPAATFPVAPA